MLRMELACFMVIAFMAILFFSIAPIMFAYPFFQKYFIKGITVGSVKG